MGGGVFVGRVVSNRMQRTVVVAVNYVVWVPKYGVYEKRVSRHMAHDAEQKCVVGDVVKIISAGRKISKHKSYNVAQILCSTPSYNPEQAAIDVQNRLENRPTSTVAAAEARLKASIDRLEALKAMYAAELKRVCGRRREGEGERSDLEPLTGGLLQGTIHSSSSSSSSSTINSKPKPATSSGESSMGQAVHSAGNSGMLPHSTPSTSASSPSSQPDTHAASVLTNKAAFSTHAQRPTFPQGRRTASTLAYQAASISDGHPKQQQSHLQLPQSTPLALSSSHCHSPQGRMQISSLQHLPADQRPRL